MSTNVVITGVGAQTATASDAPGVWEKATGGTYENPPLAKGGWGDFASPIAEALIQAQLWWDNTLQNVDSARFGCTFSASKPFLIGALEAVLPPENMSALIFQQFGLKGEYRNIIAACATGAYSVALGASWIEQGLCDVVLAGSVEPPAHPLIEAGFRQMGVLSSEKTMRPFDRQRSGFVLSSGAGAIVLESREHAHRRGVLPLASLSGWGWGSDPHSPVAFNSNGAHIAHVVRQALRRGGLAVEQIQHVNAHGTATKRNDWIETQALMNVFGKRSDQLMISATKSATGHLLGAAGSIELVLTIRALQEQFVPPTLHLQDPDPRCPLDYTPRTGHAADLEHALSLSFGFGGPIGALIVSRN